MKKVAIVITNRASYGRLKSVIKGLHESPNFELQLIIAGGALNLDIEFPIVDRLYCLVDGDSTDSMVLSSSLLSTQLTSVFRRLNPDLVFIHGDRFEMLDVAKTASYMNIPIAHTEGGEDSGTIDNKVRNAITSLADYHFVVTEKAFNRVKEITNSNNIYCVGSTSLDTVVKSDLSNNRINKYILILINPNTTVKEDFEKFVADIKKMSLPIVWVNPNFDSGAKEILKKIHQINGVVFIKNTTPEEYYRLLANCEIAVGNSSSFIKEGSFLGVKALIVGDRQHNREHDDNVKFTTYENMYCDFIDYLCLKKPRPSNMFGDGTSSRKILDILSEVLI